ncbi:MAG: glutamate synthase large chain [Clostridiales bacterium]|nr:glutamate synthase large chain [Clostridiales bacterium]
MQETRIGLPERQGMYDPALEHDACGIGFVVNIKGKRSHDIVTSGLKILANLAHRGGAGSEDNTGDGAGILLQLPHAFFKRVLSEAGTELPEPGEYGVGMVFLPRQEAMRAYVEKKIEAIVRDEGQIVISWRTLPVNDSSLGQAAKQSMPCIRQLFIGRGASDEGDQNWFERKLYIIRKRCEKLIEGLPESSSDYFYFASLSSRTIVYKGMLTAEQVDAFYVDLTCLDFDSALALVHSRYSTNTFPSWERAHPYRYLIHNGEINTLRGNVNWMNARQSTIGTELFGEEPERVFPIIHPQGSDSAMFDNCLEFLTLSGRSLAHAAMMMVPEPWSKHEQMSDDLRAFYEYHSMLMEPWDGPAAMALTDGVRVAALLDRNGLRPSRYYLTDDDMIILASEAGVLDIAPEKIIAKDRLRPGRMLLIDTEIGRIISDEELKAKIAAEHPYREWLNEYSLTLADLPETDESSITPTDDEQTALTLEQREKLYGYSYEDLREVLLPMAMTGTEPLGSMGQDTPLAVLSSQNQLLYNYFKQLFAQVTNPPIDAIREEIVTSAEVYIGQNGNLVNPQAVDCRQIRLSHPLLSNRDLNRIRRLDQPGLRAVTLQTLYPVNGSGQALEKALEGLFFAADQAISEGATILILSDRQANISMTPMPALLALAGLHHHLIRQKTRTRVSLIIESGEPREVHHIALLLGYGASAINPYLAYEVIEDLSKQELIPDKSADDAAHAYEKALVKGIIKVISKMGISTIQSYQGAQIFEAVGISSRVIDKYFTSTPSRIEGITLDDIARESAERHRNCFTENDVDPGLPAGGIYQWRSDGEYHQFNPLTVHKLQQAVRTGSYSLFREYSALLNRETQRVCTIRGLLEFRNQQPSIPLDEVESVDSIVRRFKTGAMSYGSISQEAHEALAIAMNRLGGRSNTGEGGEDPERFAVLDNGDSKNSAIKQVASGRFGVTSEYLVNARELQIKMAQGAKPGEGGQLPGEKVYPWVARTRHATPGVGLISPPPHHDIYSIEDLAELIHDLKNANSEARVSVKLVSEAGVGTIAAGVAKGRADVVLISGHDGGTGASPRTSIRHAGLPWELGLAETHQTLLLNDLRSRIAVETDGKLLTGRDVVIAALLGAEEFGFATGPLVSLGCVMMRVCNLDTCPVGVATQNPELRKRFAGKPEYVVNFMRFIAEEMRELMAELGFRTIEEMVGRTDCLEASRAQRYWKNRGLDLSCLLHLPEVSPESGRFCSQKQDHALQNTLDRRTLLPLCRQSLETGSSVRAILPIRNIDRVAGTQLGSEITRHYGAAGLPEDTIDLTFRGSAGQSFGAFIPSGLTMRLLGDSNDYIGKGLSGGKIIVKPDPQAIFKPEENIIIGNVAFYGATAGEAYIHGMAGERFCVRNSGATAVVEGVGDHGCEYMTGGTVVVLGSTGRNFAAGMSGGTAYVYDPDSKFSTLCNNEMVTLRQVENDTDIKLIRSLLNKHFEYTSSKRAQEILSNFDEAVKKFVRVLPVDYEKMTRLLKQAESEGLTGEQQALAAFERRNA